ncbi:MAG: NAD(P)H-hydrate dehydratase [Phycisphaerales bacterium]|nr:NAD(P)H-hydrate dehydratase [Phycisphaerales bacterium]
MDRITTLPTLPPRPSNAHKGVFGSTAIIGGSVGSMPLRPRMLGAPALAAEGATRAGCGLVRVAVPAPMLNTVLEMCPFATGYGLAVGADGDLIAHECAPVLDQLVDTNTTLVIGMGLGTGEGVTKLVLRAIGQREIPVVVDADALNALSGTIDFAADMHAQAVLTPHPGEARRLCSALSIAGNPAGDDQERTDVCARLAQRLACIVVLKGHRTVVSDGHQYWVCERGHPCLATGGTGDVLAGVIGSLIAQFTPGPGLSLMQCAIAGVQAHAVAGERWAAGSDTGGGMLVTDLIEKIPAAIGSLRGS